MNTAAIPPSDRMWPSSFRMPHGSRNHTLSTGLDERPGGSRWSGRCAVTVPRRDGVTFGGRRVTMMARVLRGRHGRTANTRSLLGSPERPLSDGARLPRRRHGDWAGRGERGALGTHRFVTASSLPGATARPAGAAPGLRRLGSEPGAFGRHPHSQDSDPRVPHLLHDPSSPSPRTPLPRPPTPPSPHDPRDRRQEVAVWTPA